MERRDAVVVGAGPAGSSCAWRLQQRGRDVLLLDRQSFPRDKSCAGWVTPRVLEALELTAGDYRPHGVIEPVLGFRVGVIGGRTVEVRYGQPVSYGIRRLEFDHFLAGRCGAEFRPATRVESIRRDGSRWVINEAIETPVLVGAGGHFCPVARAIGTDATVSLPVLTQEAEIAMDRADAPLVAPGVPEFFFTRDFSGYGWLFRKGDRLTVGIGRRDPKRLAEHRDAFLDWLACQGRLRRVPPTVWRGHAYYLFGSSPRPLGAAGVLLIGDAAGLAHPRSGEGIRPAVESGLIAADTIAEVPPDDAASVAEVYRQRLAAQFGHMRPVRRFSRMLPDAMVNAVGRWLVGLPWFARHVVVEGWFLHGRKIAAL